MDTMSNQHGEHTMTPYQHHATLSHADMSRYSPDGFVQIEECPTCGCRWLWHPCTITANGIPYPVYMQDYPELIQIID